MQPGIRNPGLSTLQIDYASRTLLTCPAREITYKAMCLTTLPNSKLIVLSQHIQVVALLSVDFFSEVDVYGDSRHPLAVYRRWSE